MILNYRTSGDRKPLSFHEIYFDALTPETSVENPTNT
jgi:hypothetical protein